jgi:hypothetical protein
MAAMAIVKLFANAVVFVVKPNAVEDSFTSTQLGENHY